MLTPRQETILRKVVESHASTGQPVASKTLAANYSAVADGVAGRVLRG
jgi:transcriptional regulator of heat shock response